MKKLVYAIAALPCLTAAPVLITPADAQVSTGSLAKGPGSASAPTTTAARLVPRTGEQSRRLPLAIGRDAISFTCWKRGAGRFSFGVDTGPVDLREYPIRT